MLWTFPLKWRGRNCFNFCPLPAARSLAPGCLYSSSDWRWRRSCDARVSWHRQHQQTEPPRRWPRTNCNLTVPLIHSFLTSLQLAVNGCHLYPSCFGRFSMSSWYASSRRSHFRVNRWLVQSSFWILLAICHKIWKIWKIWKAEHIRWSVSLSLDSKPLLWARYVQIYGTGFERNLCSKFVDDALCQGTLQGSAIDVCSLRNLAI